MDDDDDITPARAYRALFTWAPVAAVTGSVIVVVSAIILLVGWQVGGWFQQHAIQRNYGNTVQSQPYQDTLLAQMQAHLENISGPGGLADVRAGIPAGSPEQQVLRAQELNELDGLCAESARFVPRMEGPAGQQLQAIITANCLAGVPVASPPLASTPVT